MEHIGSGIFVETETTSEDVLDWKLILTKPHPDGDTIALDRSEMMILRAHINLFLKKQENE